MPSGLVVPMPRVTWITLLEAPICILCTAQCSPGAGIGGPCSAGQYPQQASPDCQWWGHADLGRPEMTRVLILTALAHHPAM